MCHGLLHCTYVHLANTSRVHGTFVHCIGARQSSTARKRRALGSAHSRARPARPPSPSPAPEASARALHGLRPPTAAINPGPPLRFTFECERGHAHVHTLHSVMTRDGWVEWHARWVSRASVGRAAARIVPSAAPPPPRAAWRRQPGRIPAASYLYYQ